MRKLYQVPLTVFAFIFAESTRCTQFGSCLGNVQYCNITESFIGSYCPWITFLLSSFHRSEGPFTNHASIGGSIWRNLRPWTHKTNVFHEQLQRQSPKICSYIYNKSTSFKRTQTPKKWLKWPVLLSKTSVLNEHSKRASVLGPVSRKPWKLFGPGARFSKVPKTFRARKAIFNDLYLKKKAVYRH